MSLASRQVAKPFPAFMARRAAPSQEVSERLPEWLTPELQLLDRVAQKTTHEKSLSDQLTDEACSTSSSVQGTYYEVYVGARLKLYSTKKNEEHLRNMHEVNHRELPIARLAARVADYLWPNCQEMIDEAIAKTKNVRKQRAMAEEEIFVPPSVPHFLPITNWIRNNEILRESFVCDKSTRYKPRMTWYNPNDGMIPSNFWSEGLLGDLAYYKPLSGTRQAHQEW